MNFFQVISSRMNEWEAVAFWVFLFASILLGVLVVIGFRLDYKYRIEDANKHIANLKKENADLARRVESLKELYQSTEQELLRALDKTKVS